MLRMADESTTFVDITLFQKIPFFAEQNRLALEESKAISLDSDKSQLVCLKYSPNDKAIL